MKKAINILLILGLLVVYGCKDGNENDPQPMQTTDPDPTTFTIINNTGVTIYDVSSISYSGTLEELVNDFESLESNFTNHKTTMGTGEEITLTAQNTNQIYVSLRLFSDGDVFIIKNPTQLQANTNVNIDITGETNIINTAQDEWTEVASSAPWSARSNHTSIAFNNKIWIMERDIWSSSDGKIWTQIASNDWPIRGRHSSVTFDNKIWMLGGNYLRSKNDVWSSPDGETWTQVTSSAGWLARSNHTSVIFNDRIWVIGGFFGSDSDGNSFFGNDIWSSPDGKTWTRVTSSADWSARFHHTSVVFNDKIWVIGGWDGSNKNDVWSSPDGKTWTRVTSSADWSKRNGHTSLVFDNKIWVIENDVWSSPDGKTWTEVTASTDWTGRSVHASVIFDNKIWVTGGYDGDKNLNDVWSYGR